MMRNRLASWMVGSALALLSHPAPLDALTTTVAQETLAVVAPLVERAGFGAQRSVIEDASFRILEPETHAALTVAHRADELEGVRAGISRRLQDAGIVAVVTSRLKSAYSTHRKMERRGVELHEIMDRLGVRVRVDTVQRCDEAMALMQEAFPEVPGSYDDYIRSPRPSGYQSLHTTLRIPGVGPVELQVRTHAMHAEAEYGAAAHWRYKLAV